MLRAAFKSLLGRKVRLLMSTFAIVLGAAFVVGTLLFSDTLSRSFTAIFASTVGDVVVTPDNSGDLQAQGAESGVTLPASLVDKLEDVDGAARVDGNVSTIGVFTIGTDGKVIGGQGAPGLGVNWTGAPAGHGLEGVQIIEGHEPQGRDQVVLDEDTADKAGYDVGDTAKLITSGSKSNLEVEVVGIAGYDEGGSLGGASLAIFDTRTAQKLFLDGKDAYTDIWVTADDGVSQDTLRDRVADELPNGVKAETGDDAAEESASLFMEAISFLRTFLLIFAAVALVVGAFLIVNTFSILVAQRGRELALLRALGASRRQVTGSVLLEALVLGVVGGTLGLGLGYLLALGIRAMFAQFGLDITGYSLVFRPGTFIAAYGVSIVVTLVAAWIPARKAARVAPVQAMRDDVALPESSVRHRLLIGALLAVVGGVCLVLGLFTGVPKGGWFVGAGVLGLLLGVTAASAWLSRPYLLAARAIYRRLFGTVGNLAGENSLRNPRRTTATASALMIGLALAGTMSIVGASAKASVDQAVEDNFVGDFIISNAVGQSFSPAYARQAAKVAGVDAVMRVRSAPLEADGEVKWVTGVDADQLGGLLQLNLVDGEESDFGNGDWLIDENTADDRGWKVGDKVKTTTIDGKHTFTVAGIYEENPLTSGVVMTIHDLVKAGYADKDSLLVVDAAAGSSTVEQSLDDIVKESPILTVKDQAAFAEEQRAPIDQMVLMIFALLGLALIIAILGIVNTLALSIIERTREIGLLRAIGFSRGQTRLMVTLESVLIAVLGALLGVIMGIFFGIVLMYALRDEGLEVISVPWGQLIAFVIAAIVVGVLAAVLPARRAAKLDVLRAISTE